MGNNRNSIPVLQIQLKFWWMIPIGVKHNHTTIEQETQWWRPGMGVTSGRPRFQNLSKVAKKCPFGGNLVAQHVHAEGHLQWN